jgi:hypothetical protein
MKYLLNIMVMYKIADKSFLIKEIICHNKFKKLQIIRHKNHKIMIIKSINKRSNNKLIMSQKIMKFISKKIIGKKDINKKTPMNGYSDTRI